MPWSSPVHPFLSHHWPQGIELFSCSLLMKFFSSQWMWSLKIYRPGMMSHLMQNLLWVRNKGWTIWLWWVLQTISKKKNRRPIPLNKTKQKENPQSAFSYLNPDLWLPRADFINVPFLFNILKISWLALSSSIKLLNVFVTTNFSIVEKPFPLDSVCSFLSKIFSYNYLADLWEIMLMVSGTWGLGLMAGHQELQ